MPTARIVRVTDNDMRTIEYTPESIKGELDVEFDGSWFSMVCRGSPLMMNGVQVHQSTIVFSAHYVRSVSCQ